MPTFNSWADGIKDLLVAANCGVFNTAGTWQIVIGQTTELTNTLIVINETGGKQSNPAWAIDYPSIQVKVRGNVNGYQAAREKIRDIKNALLGLPSQDLNGDRWTAINAIGDITSMGVDQNNRPSFVMNFALIVEPSNAGYRE